MTLPFILLIAHVVPSLKCDNDQDMRELIRVKWVHGSTEQYICPQQWIRVLVVISPHADINAFIKLCMVQAVTHVRTNALPSVWLVGVKISFGASRNWTVFEYVIITILFSLEYYLDNFLSDLRSNKAACDTTKSLDRWFLVTGAGSSVDTGGRRETPNIQQFASTSYCPISVTLAVFTNGKRSQLILHHTELMFSGT